MRIPLLTAWQERRALRRRFREVEAQYCAYQKSPLAKEHAERWRYRHKMPPVGIGNWVTRSMGATWPGEPPDDCLVWEINYRLNAMEGREQCFGCGRMADKEPGVLYNWDLAERLAEPLLA